MIDKILLRQLNWSDDLIEEVTRVATPMRDLSKKLQFKMDEPQLTDTVGSSIFINENINGGTQIIKIMAK